MGPRDPTRALLAVLACLFCALVGCSSPPYGPLHSAAVTGDISTIQTLLAHGRNVDEVYNDTGITLETSSQKVRGLTALMVAAKNGRLEAVKLLVHAGANIYLDSHRADGSDPTNAFDDAIRAGHGSIAEFLWDNSDKIHFVRKLEVQLVDSCRQYCDEKFGQNPDNVALFIAGKIADDRNAFVRAIGAIATQPDGDGLQHLEFLTNHGVRFPGASLDFFLKHYARLRVHGVDHEIRIKIARVLLDNGSSLNDQIDSMTPLMLSSSLRDPEMVTLLLERGADLRAVNESGATAIMLAADYCAKPNSPYESLDYVEELRKQQLDVIQQLLRAGATITITPAMTHVVECCAMRPQPETQASICKQVSTDSSQASP